MFFSRHCHVFWCEKKKFPEKIPFLSGRHLIHDALPALRAAFLMAIWPGAVPQSMRAGAAGEFNGTHIWSTAAVHARGGRGVQNQELQMAAVRPFCYLYRYIFSFCAHGGAVVPEPRFHGVHFRSLRKAQRGAEMELPRRKTLSFSLPAPMESRKSRGSAPGERGARPGSASRAVSGVRAILRVGQERKPFVPGRPGQEGTAMIPLQRNASFLGETPPNKILPSSHFFAFFSRKNEIQVAGSA